MKTEIIIPMAEHICSYCSEPYIAKRTDSNYCSHSCRQLAYVQRKTKTPAQVPESSKSKTKNTQSAKNPENKPTPLEKSFQDELVEIIHRRNNIKTLEFLLYDASPQNSSLWVSVRYKYLTECLLNFSETPHIYLKDIKEVFSAFITVQQSTHFMCLPFSYPYSKEIQQLTNNLKALCLNMEMDEPFKFELAKPTKLLLMAIGCELESFIPKNSYCQLNFKA